MIYYKEYRNLMANCGCVINFLVKTLSTGAIKNVFRFSQARGHWPDDHQTQSQLYLYICIYVYGNGDIGRDRGRCTTSQWPQAVGCGLHSN